MSPSILAGMTGALTFTKEGEWLHDGEKVTHELISRYFTKHLHYSEEHGCFVIEADGLSVAVQVEDTPTVISSLETNHTPWGMILSSGEEGVFPVHSLCISEENVFYCYDPEGKLLRLSRQAAQALFPYIEARAEGYVVTTDSGETSIVACLRSELKCPVPRK